MFLKLFKIFNPRNNFYHNFNPIFIYIQNTHLYAIQFNYNLLLYF